MEVIENNNNEENQKVNALNVRKDSFSAVAQQVIAVAYNTLQDQMLQKD